MPGISAKMRVLARNKLSLQSLHGVVSSDTKCKKCPSLFLSPVFASDISLLFPACICLSIILVCVVRTYDGEAHSSLCFFLRFWN